MAAHSSSTSPSPPGKEAQSQTHHHKPHEDATVPWFPSPMVGYNEETESFSPRHEASTIELFFDLWFVANLATFTAYHAITNRYNFWSYVAFFMVLWTSWFHVVCFDTRFAYDSVWERASKTVHFCAFAAFALAGYKFAPVAKDVDSATPHWIYRVLCFAVLLSRAWLALQYLVTAIMCSEQKHRKHRLTLPLALNALLFLSVAAIFGGLFAGFSTRQTNLTGILIGVYICLTAEFFGTLVLSMAWKKLSFRATHVGERLGLLGLIIIGEGVIGTTKTITRTMGKHGPNVEASAQIFCAILILLFMWILYFDRVPKYRFGNVQQIMWMALHLPFHLAILGVVEGSQQLAQARYIYKNIERMGRQVQDACLNQHLNGTALTTSLTKNIEYFKINESARGREALKYVYKEIYLLGNASTPCSPANTTDLQNDIAGIPLSFTQFLSRAVGAMFQSLEIDIPPESENAHSINIALQSWTVVYTYFWSAIILLLACYMITSLLADSDQGRWRSSWTYFSGPIRTRAAMTALAVVMLVLGLNTQSYLQEYVSSPWILPTVVLSFWLVCLSDRTSKIWDQRKARKTKYESVAAGDMDRNDEHELGGVRRRATNSYGYPSHGVDHAHA